MEKDYSALNTSDLHLRLQVLSKLGSVQQKLVGLASKLEKTTSHPDTRTALSELNQMADEVLEAIESFFSKLQERLSNYQKDNLAKLISEGMIQQKTSKISDEALATNLCNQAELIFNTFFPAGDTEPEQYRNQIKTSFYQAITHESVQQQLRLNGPSEAGKEAVNQIFEFGSSSALISKIRRARKINGEADAKFIFENISEEDLLKTFVVSGLQKRPMLGSLVSSSYKKLKEIEEKWAYGTRLSQEETHAISPFKPEDFK